MSQARALLAANLQEFIMVLAPTRIQILEDDWLVDEGPVGPLTDSLLWVGQTAYPLNWFRRLAISESTLMLQV